MAIDEQGNVAENPKEQQIIDWQAEKLRQSLLVTQRETLDQEPYNAVELPEIGIEGSAQAVNPSALVDTLMKVANALDSARNQVAGGLQAQMTAAQVAQIQAKNQIKQQVNQGINQPAEAMGKVVNQVEAQLAGQIADAGEKVFVPQESKLPAAVEKRKKEIEKSLIRIGFTPEHAAQQVPVVDPKLWPTEKQPTPAEYAQTVKVNGRDVPLWQGVHWPWGIGEWTDDSLLCQLPYLPVNINGRVRDCKLPGNFENAAAPAKDQIQQQPEEKPAEDKPKGDCIRVEVCNWPEDKKTEEEKAACKKWKLYKSSKGICYVVPSDESPKSTDDELVTEGEFSQDWVDRIVSQCGKDKEETEEEQEESTPSNNDFVPVRTNGCLEGIETSFMSSSNFGTGFRALLGQNTSGTPEGQMDSWLGTPDGFWRGLIQGLVGSSIGDFGKGMDEIAKASGCSSPEVLQARVALTLQGLIRWITPDAFNDVVADINYQKNGHCQFLLPTAEQALVQYLSATIPASELRCLAEVNGHKWKWFAPNVESSRSKHSPLDQASLLRRNIISRVEFDKRIREQGYIRSSDASEIFKLTEQLPPPQDIIRFMVRDADNQDIVNTFKLDTGFTENFGGKLQEWADNQGVTEEYMKYLWRAHWDIPSPTQLYEMWRRLRHTAEYNNNGQLEGEIRKALIQQDIAPFWIDRLLALSYSPLTRTDAKRAYEIGSIDKSELWTSFIEGGYSDENANRLVDFTDKQVQLKWYRHPIVKQFAAGFASESELASTLAFEGATQEHIELVKQKARVYTRVESRKACTKALRKRYMIGDIDEFEIVPKLTQLGVDAETAAMLSSGWVCERQTRGKILPLRTLSSLYREGIIGDEKFVKSLLALQYDADTAMDLLLEQRWKKQAADDAEQKKRDDKLKADAIKQQKQAEKIAAANAKMQAGDQKLAAQIEREKAAKKKAEEVAAAKSKAAAEKGLKVIADRREKLDNMQLDMAVNVTKKTGEYLGDSLRTIKQYIAQSKANGIDPLDFAECGLAASKVFSEGSTSEFLKQWESCWTSPPASA